VYIRRLLCPIDFSECSRLALYHAGAIAGWYGAELHALHVIATDAVAPLVHQCRVSLGLPPSTPLPVPVQAQTPLTDETLVALLSAHALSKNATRTAVRRGDPAQQILAYARQTAIDLIVLGTRLAPSALCGDAGAIVTRVWRDQVCQTLLIPQDTRGHAGEASAHLARMLAAFDGSSAVLRGSTLALSLT
jgi:nucleotide-binding universal stress UspA family protein